METQALDDQCMQTELEAVKEEVAHMEHATRIKNERIHQLEESMRRLQNDLDNVTRVVG